MIIFVFLGLCGALSTASIIYGVFKFIKSEAEIRRLERKRKKAAHYTLIQVQSTLKEAENGSFTPQQLETLQALENTLRHGIY